jgi:glycosyltransferase involved in cell wall biosynthesis
LHVTEVPAGGVGRSLVDLVVGQIERGFDVTVIYSAKRADKNFLAFLDSRPQARFIAIPMRRSPHFSDIAVVGKVRRVLKEDGPFDVIHGHSSKGAAIARLAGIGKKIICIYTPHCIYTLNPLLNPFTYQFYRWIELGLSLVTDQIIADSLEEEAHLLSLGMSRARVTYIPNAVAAAPAFDKAETRKALGLPHPATIIGWIGKLELQKDPTLIVRSFGEVAKKHRDAVLAIAGIGPIQSEMQQLARDCGVEDRVFFLGFRPGLQVMGACDIYAMTSRYEGLAYVLLEALSSGLPIVTTDMLVAHCVVDEDVNGTIVSRRDPVDFGQALSALVENPDRCRAFGRESLRKSKNFELSKMIDDTIRVYTDLLPRDPQVVLQ